ncbi:MAG TPA: hypothetical protein VL242_46700, partial [Sorangium sp.]|nr:hypothetical protein [Sorangium sp.]
MNDVRRAPEPADVPARELGAEGDLDAFRCPGVPGRPLPRRVLVSRRPGTPATSTRPGIPASRDARYLDASWSPGVPGRP